MKTFEEQQQELVDIFKEKMKNVCEDVIGDFYSDVTPYAEHDATINFKNELRKEIYAEIVKEIKSEYSHYSWAHSIRMALLKQHKEELQNKIIEDLQEKLKAAEQRYFELCKRY